MIVRMTMSAARVKPRSPEGAGRRARGADGVLATTTTCALPPALCALPRAVWRPIESIPRRFALHVGDARLAAGADRGRIDRHGARVGRAGAGGGGPDRHLLTSEEHTA